MFPQADLSFFEEKVDENCRIVDILRKYMEPQDRLEEHEKSLISTADSEKLCYYHSASYGGIVVLLQASLCQGTKKYSRMFLSKSLKVNLAHKKIIEYPIICVVLKDHIDAYDDDINSDDENLTAILNENENNAPNFNNSGKENSLEESKSSAKTRMTQRDGGLNFFDAFSDSSEEEAE